MSFVHHLRKPIFLLTLLFLLVGIMVNLSGKTAASPQGSYLTAVQMTDHVLTGEDASYNLGLRVAMGPNAAHVIWRERNTTSIGSDLFYRSLPNGTTQRLSDVVSANNADVFLYPSIQVSTNNIPHVIWEEYTSSVDFRDINYWNPIDGVVSLVSQTPTVGYNNFRPILWLEGNEAHIVWQQRNASQTEDIYMYWNSLSQTAQELPDFEAGVVQNGSLHITWAASDNGPVQYWNSSSQSTTSLPNSTSSGDTIVRQKGIIARGTDEIDIFFGITTLVDPATTCLASWNSITQNTTTHVTGNLCYSLNTVQIDGNGVFHAFGVDTNLNPTTRLPYYWNSSLAGPIFFDVSGAGTGFFIPSANLYLAENGKAHLLWEDDNDLFYWNPDDQAVINLSESMGANTSIASYFKFKSFDSAGNLTFIWQEQTSPTSSYAPFYWQSEEKITTNLLTKLGMSSIDEQSFAYANTPGPVYLFYGVPAVGDAGAFYWDIADDTVTPVWTGGVTNTFFRYKEGLGNEIFTAWVDQATGSLTVNSSAKGNEVLNQTAADDTDNLIYLLATDDFKNLYAIWTEMSDSSGEGLDFFAAWSTAFLEVSDEQYLPFATR